MSAYRPSPRPNFDEATALRRADVVTYTWGDEGSGEVQDWIYVSSEKIHQLVFGLPPGGVFRHSDDSARSSPPTRCSTCSPARCCFRTQHR